MTAEEKAVRQSTLLPVSSELAGEPAKVLMRKQVSALWMAVVVARSRVAGSAKKQSVGCFTVRIALTLYMSARVRTAACAGIRATEMVPLGLQLIAGVGVRGVKSMTPCGFITAVTETVEALPVSVALVFVTDTPPAVNVAAAKSVALRTVPAPTAAVVVVGAAVVVTAVVVTEAVIVTETVVVGATVVVRDAVVGLATVVVALETVLEEVDAVVVGATVVVAVTGLTEISG